MPTAELDEAGEQIELDAAWKDTPGLKLIPGSKHSAKRDKWTVPVSWGACQTIRGVFGQELVVGPRLNAWARNEFTVRVQPSLALRDTAEWSEVPTDITDPRTLKALEIARGWTKPYEYQAIGAAWLVTARQAYLEDDPGTGKTLQTLYAMRLAVELGENPFPALVVTPNSVKRTWENEAKKWWPGLKVQVVGGSAAVRRTQLESQAHVYVMNWEALRGHSRLANYGSLGLKRCKECGGQDERISASQCQCHSRELQQLSFNTVVADECFTGDVLISTPNGERKISEIKPGDAVYGYDHDTERTTVETVTDTMTRLSNSIIDGLECTPNHPFYVAGEGYRAAGDLKDDDLLVTNWEDQLLVHRPHDGKEEVHNKDVFRVHQCNKRTRQDVLRRLQEKARGTRDDVRVGERFTGYQDAVHLHDLFGNFRCHSSALDAVARTQGALRTSDLQPNMLESLGLENGQLCSVWAQVPVPASKWSAASPQLQQKLQFNSNSSTTRHEGTQRAADERNNGASRCASKNTSASTWTQQSVQKSRSGRTVAAIEADLAAGGKWSSLDSSNSSTNCAVGSTSTASVGVSSNDGRRRDSTVLRAGSAISGSDADRRSGWMGAPRPQGVRRAENTASESARVRRHPLLELRDRDQYERVCAEGARTPGDEARVYSLTTTSGNYFAHGILVRNCHKSKDPRSQQTRALWAATGEAQYRWALSGTPIANAPDDLWTALHWLAPEEHRSRNRYVERFCALTYNAWGAVQVTGLNPATQDEFYRIVDPRLRRMSKSRVLKWLPEKVYERRNVELGGKQLKAYVQMRDKMLAELDDQLVTTTSPLSKLTRLLQFASSYAEVTETQDEQGRVHTQVHLTDPSSKLDALMDDWDDLSQDALVVFAVSRQLIDLTGDRLEKLGVKYGRVTGSESPEERQAYVDDFQAGNIKVMLCTVAAGGVGLTLTAARTAVFLQRPWSNIDNEQAENRVHRPGSEIHDSIRIVEYVTENTVELEVLAALETKGDRLEEIVRDKQTLRRILGADA